jgi:hypothetical protein
MEKNPNARSVPEFIDPVFAKTTPKRSFSVTKNERYGVVFAKTEYINSVTGIRDKHSRSYFRDRSNSFLGSKCLNSLPSQFSGSGIRCS